MAQAITEILQNGGRAEGPERSMTRGADRPRLMAPRRMWWILAAFGTQTHQVARRRGPQLADPAQSPRRRGSRGPDHAR
jgi:hypothetical protein